MILTKYPKMYLRIYVRFSISCVFVFKGSFSRVHPEFMRRTRPVTCEGPKRGEIEKKILFLLAVVRARHTFARYFRGSRKKKEKKNHSGAPPTFRK